MGKHVGFSYSDLYVTRRGRRVRLALGSLDKYMHALKAPFLKKVFLFTIA